MDVIGPCYLCLDSLGLHQVMLFMSKLVNRTNRVQNDLGEKQKRFLLFGKVVSYQ